MSRRSRVHGAARRGGREQADEPRHLHAHYADFVDVFARVLGDPALPHLFFIEGGALAVENALKCAFDWKSRHNEMHGRPASWEQGHPPDRAFHGRSGYTLSLPTPTR
jgi:L-lysine 6-transaminase